MLLISQEHENPGLLHLPISPSDQIYYKLKFSKLHFLLGSFNFPELQDPLKVRASQTHSTHSHIINVSKFSFFSVVSLKATAFSFKLCFSQSLFLTLLDFKFSE